jgi:hypothetical protein
MVSPGGIHSLLAIKCLLARFFAYISFGKITWYHSAKYPNYINIGIYTTIWGCYGEKQQPLYRVKELFTL